MHLQFKNYIWDVQYLIGMPQVCMVGQCLNQQILDCRRNTGSRELKVHSLTASYPDWSLIPTSMQPHIV